MCGLTGCRFGHTLQSVGGYASQTETDGGVRRERFFYSTVNKNWLQGASYPVCRDHQGELRRVAEKDVLRSRRA